MSRSYKKHPFLKESSGKSNKWIKRQANKKVRKESNVSNGKQFRRYFPSWDICDYTFYGGTLEEAKMDWKESERLQWKYPDMNDYLNHWKKWYRRK